MKRLIPLIAFVMSLFLACKPNTQQQSGNQPENTVATTPEGNAAPEGLQPPYPIADSSQIQSIDGIQIYVVERGQGAIPKPGSHVIINYHGYLTDGSVFDSSFERDGVMDFELGKLIRGWQIGLTQVPTGSKVKLIIPPELGYGAQAQANIPANSTLIFDIDLISTY